MNNLDRFDNIDIGTDMQNAKEKSESAWKHVDFAHDEMRNNAIKDLEEYQRASGQNEKKHIEDLKKAKSNGEIKEKINKIKKAGVKWVEVLLNRSGVYEPMHDKERMYMNQQKSNFLDWIKGLDLSGEHGLIGNVMKWVPQTIDARKKFRNKLKKQSSFVREEYFRRVGSLALDGSQHDLLNDILKELDGLEDQPSCVQYEFKKAQKEAGSRKSTNLIREEVMNKFETQSRAYSGIILKNLNFFGGKMVLSPYGKIPLTAFEFIEWFNELDSFAEMDSAKRKLPNLIKKRKRLFNKRDEIISSALPKDQDRLRRKTNLMRRHELEAFLPELDKQVRKKSIHVAEYMSSIIGARTRGVSLFQPFERTVNIRKFKLKNIGDQQSKIHQLEEEIDERAQVVEEYFALPYYIRNDQAFLNANALDRERILLEAKEELHREQSSPFQTDHLDKKPLGAEDTLNIADSFDTEEGNKAVENVFDKLQQEGHLDPIQVQMDTMNRIQRAAEQAALHEESQKDHYLRDLKYWVRLDQNTKSELDITNDRDAAKWNFIQMADNAYDAGYTVTSGGEIDELQEINFDQLRQGSNRVEKQLREAKYAEHIQVKDREGKESIDPMEMIAEMSETEMMKILMLAIQKLGKNHLNLGDSNMSLLQNSTNIEKAMTKKFINSEFGRSANNNTHFKNRLTA